MSAPDVRLTEAEREAVRQMAYAGSYSREKADRYVQTVERIIAARVQQAEAERDEAIAQSQRSLQRAHVAEFLASTDTSALDKILAAERERIAQAIEALPGPGEVGIKDWPSEQQEAYLLAIEEAVRAARIAREGGAS